MELTEAERDIIRQNAYFCWLNAGAPRGDGMPFWLEAESRYLRNAEEGSPPQVEFEQDAPAPPATEWDLDSNQIEPGQVRTSEEVLAGSR